MTNQPLCRRSVIAGLLASPLYAMAGRAETFQDEMLRNLFEASFNRRLSRSPFLQARSGLNTMRDRWDDISDDKLIEDGRLLTEDLRAARSHLASSVSKQTHLSLRIFISTLEAELSNIRWRNHGNLVSQMGGIHDQVVSTLLNNHPITSYADADAYISRLQGVQPLFKQLIVRLEGQRNAGITPPSFICELVAESIRRLLVGWPFDHAEQDNIIFADFRAKLQNAHIAAEATQRLEARARKAMLESFEPGYRLLLDHLESILQNRTDTPVGAWSLPAGDQFYAAQLKRFTTTPVRASELHAIGLREVARIENEMRSLLESIGFSGSIVDYWEHLRSTPSTYFPQSPSGRAAYLSEATAMLESVSKRGEALFGKHPRAKVEVRAVEAWRETSAPRAFYASAPKDMSKPAVYYVNLHDMRALPRYELPALLFHEAFPGHHIETMLAHEQDGLPTFRKYLSIAAYSEGWALYAEQLSKESGFYPDAAAVFGQLSMSMLRAARLVVDTGIHALRWTREQAVAYLDTVLPSSPESNRREIDRYIAIPGQATAYATGFLEILRLRDRAKNAQKSSFNLSEFHDVALGEGPLPLPILAEIVEDWIAKR